MSIIKKLQDNLIKLLFGNIAVPRGLYEMNRYFKNNGSIEFKYAEKDNLIVATSTNFRYGSIITSGKNKKELDQNIKDAILTSFEIPSSYSKEAGIHKVGEKEYAFA